MKTKPTIKSFAGLKAAIKSLSVLILLCLTSPALFSQEYIPIAVEGAQWIIKYDDTDTPQPVDDLWEYYASGDTTVDNQSWKKIYKRDLVTSNDPPPFEVMGDYELYGLMRDDVESRQVYAIQIMSGNYCPENEEFLLYDFSLEAGDTADFCLIPEYVDFTVDTIMFDTYLGFKTNMFANNAGYYYYEGMGSNFGLFEFMFYPLKSQQRKFPMQTYLYYYCREAPCNLVLSTNKISARNQKLDIFPNPAKSSMNVILPDMTNDGLLVIMNPQGQVIKRIAVQKSAKEAKINVNDLPAGIYSISLTLDEVIVTTKKFVVGQ